MVVISDTSCISALLRMNQVNLLPQLFGDITIPLAVFNELLQLADFDVDVSPITSETWLRVIQPSANHLLAEMLLTLDEGEAHAIALAIELHADLLIIDERKGRKVAQARSLPYSGLGGVLIRAKTFGLIPSVRMFLDQAESIAGFYLTAKARAVILDAAGESADD